LLVNITYRNSTFPHVAVVLNMMHTTLNTCEETARISREASHMYVLATRQNV